MQTDVHSTLLREAISRLKSQGFVCQEEALLAEGLRVDILATRGKEKVAVECQLQVQPKWVKKRLDEIRKHVDKVVILVPKNEAGKLKGLGVEVWASERILASGKRTYFLKLSPEATIALETVMFDIKMELMKREKAGRGIPEDEVVKELLKDYLECIRVRDRGKYEHLIREIREAGGEIFFEG